MSATKEEPPAKLKGGSKAKAGKPKPVYSTLELGTGDMVVPLMLSVSAYKLALSPWDSISVLIGAAFGLYFVLWYVSKHRTFLPALPPISFFAVLSLALLRISEWSVALIIH